jgi:acetylornithine deacetylase
MPSVNPMGRPWSGGPRVEKGVADYLESLFAPLGASLERTNVNEMHENLLVTIPGETDAPGVLFESHMDTVPADDWLDRAFTPRVEGDTVYGRGANDDKGCLAAMALAAMDLLQSEARPRRTVYFLAAGDEECRQTGIKLFRETGPPVAAGVFGEPTLLRPVIQHKGTQRWDITVLGKSAHTSRPELGVNAIHGMMRVIEEIAQHQEELRRSWKSDLMTGPALTVSMIRGGRTRNAVPDECTISVDFRLIPGMDLEGSLADLKARLASLCLEIEHSELQIRTPPLNTPPGDPFAQTVLAACRRHAGVEVQFEGVPYGTDAAWIADRAPCIVLGPGSIETAHAIDEQVSLGEVVACAAIYRDIMLA